jgi:hypothetical protein
MSLSVQAQVRKEITAKTCGAFGPLDRSFVYEWEAGPDDKARKYVEMICKEESLAQNFIIKRADIATAMSTYDDNNNRCIYYSLNFFQNNDNKWGLIAILAHEIGHQVNNDALSKNSHRPIDELMADEFAGKVICRLHGSIKDAKLLLSQNCATQETDLYPSRDARLEALSNGYENAGCRSSDIGEGIKQEFNTSYRLKIDNTNHFDAKPFTIDDLDLERNFKIDFVVQCYLSRSVRYGIAFNYVDYRNSLLFTVHDSGHGGFSIASSANFDYNARFAAGDAQVNGVNAPELLELEKNDNVLIFRVNGTEVWRTRQYKVESKQFAIWVADTADVGILSYTLYQ